MASGDLTHEVDIFPSEHTSVVENAKLFSLGMKRLFTGKAIGGQSQTAKKFRQLCDNTRNDAVMYLNHVLPVVTRCVADIRDYFEKYEVLTMDGWWESIDDIVEVAKSNEEACNVIIEIHEGMLPILKMRKDDAEILAYEAKKVEDPEDPDRSLEGWEVGIAAAIAGPVLVGFAQKASADSASEQKKCKNENALVRDGADCLVPTLGNFIDALYKVTGLFDGIYQQLKRIQGKGKQSKKSEKPRVMHYKMMKREASEIEGRCRRLLSALSSVHTDFQAIPNEGIDQINEDKWLEKQKALKGLKARKIKVTTPVSDAEQSKGEVGKTRKLILLGAEL